MFSRAMSLEIESAKIFRSFSRLWPWNLQDSKHMTVSVSAETVPQAVYHENRNQKNFLVFTTLEVTPEDERTANKQTNYSCSVEIVTYQREGEEKNEKVRN